MPFEPPGLEETPDDSALAGFSSLMPPPDDKPGIVRRILAVPFRILALPFRLIKAILGFPVRLFRRGSDG